MFLIFWKCTVLNSSTRVVDDQVSVVYFPKISEVLGPNFQLRSLENLSVILIPSVNQSDGHNENSGLRGRNEKTK